MVGTWTIENGATNTSFELASFPESIIPNVSTTINGADRASGVSFSTGGTTTVGTIDGGTIGNVVGGVVDSSNFPSQLAVTLNNGVKSSSVDFKLHATNSDDSFLNNTQGLTGTLLPTFEWAAASASSTVKYCSRTDRGILCCPLPFFHVDAKTPSSLGSGSL